MSTSKTLESILGKDDNTIDDDNEYHAFRKSNSSVYSLRIIFRNGNQQLLPFSLIGIIDYNKKEDAILIPSSGETLLVSGKNIVSAIDLLHNRQIAYMKEAPSNYQAKSDDEPIIDSFIWVESEK